jgi:PKD repeat protein
MMMMMMMIMMMMMLLALALFSQIMLSGVVFAELASTFTVSTMTGSNILYIFDFGDGSPTVSTTTSSQMHTYDSAGVYTVVVTAANSIGSTTTTRTITVLNQPITGAQTTSTVDGLDAAFTFQVSCLSLCFV